MSLHWVHLTKAQALAAAALALTVSPEQPIADPVLKRRWGTIQEALNRTGHKAIQAWTMLPICLTGEEGAALLTAIGHVRVEGRNSEQAEFFEQLLKTVATLLRIARCKPLGPDEPLPMLVVKVGMDPKPKRGSHSYEG